MSVVEPGSVGAGLIARVKGILLQPRATWEVIDAEPATVGGLYRGYILPLAAIPAVCSALGMMLIGVGGFGFNVKMGPVAALSQAITSYVLSLVMVYVLALIIDALAPNFGGTKNPIQALKVATYAQTPAWVAGVLMLLPSLALLCILAGLYGLYLLYLGMPRLMRAPEEKALPYTAVVIVAALVLSLVTFAIVNAVKGAMSMGGMSVASSAMSGTVTVPGGGSMDLGKLEAAAKQAEAAARQMQTGTDASGNPLPVTDPEVLKVYLPAAIGGFTRGEVSSSSSGVGNMTGSNAEAKYSRGDATLRISITDLGAVGALGAMANAFNVQSTKETSDGYEKVHKVGGRMTQESYSRSAQHGEYSVLAGDRFMIQAEGDKVTMEDLKAAVAAVNPDRMEALAKAG